VTPRFAADRYQVGSNTADIGWQDYFADAGPQALIGQALANNRDLRVTLLRVEEARAAYGIRRAEQFPTLDALAGVDRLRQIVAFFVRLLLVVLPGWRRFDPLTVLPSSLAGPYTLPMRSIRLETC
jgi:outer membrane protein TolC